MDSGFSMIIANFRREKLDDVEKTLERLGVERINVSKVSGFGEYHNHFARNWLDSEVRVEIYTKSREVEAIVAGIIAAASTGLPGDGIVAVLPIERLYLIRTRAEATPDTFWPREKASAADANGTYGGAPHLSGQEAGTL